MRQGPVDRQVLRPPQELDRRETGRTLGYLRSPGLEESDFTSIQQRLREVAEEQRQAEEKAAVGIVATAQGSRRPDLFAFARPGEIETEDRLPVGFGQYVELLAATGVMVRGGNPGGELPERSRTLLSKLGIDGQRWVETVVNYHRHLFSMVGHVHQIAIYCARTEREQAKGTAWAAKLFRDSA